MGRPHRLSLTSQVEPKPSLRPNAGMGLFACRDIAAGEVIDLSLIHFINDYTPMTGIPVDANHHFDVAQYEARW